MEKIIPERFIRMCRLLEINTHPVHWKFEEINQQIVVTFIWNVGTSEILSPPKPTKTRSGPSKTKEIGPENESVKTEKEIKEENLCSNHDKPYTKDDKSCRRSDQLRNKSEKSSDSPTCTKSSKYGDIRSYSKDKSSRKSENNHCDAREKKYLSSNCDKKHKSSSHVNKKANTRPNDNKNHSKDSDSVPVPEKRHTESSSSKVKTHRCENLSSEIKSSESDKNESAMTTKSQSELTGDRNENCAEVSSSTYKKRHPSNSCEKVHSYECADIVTSSSDDTPNCEKSGSSKMDTRFNDSPRTKTHLANTQQNSSLDEVGKSKSQVSSSVKNSGSKHKSLSSGDKSHKHSITNRETKCLSASDKKSSSDHSSNENRRDREKRNVPETSSRNIVKAKDIANQSEKHSKYKVDSRKENGGYISSSTSTRDKLSEAEINSCETPIVETSPSNKVSSSHSKIRKHSGEDLRTKTLSKTSSKAVVPSDTSAVETKPSHKSASNLLRSINLSGNDLKSETSSKVSMIDVPSSKKSIKSELKSHPTTNQDSIKDKSETHKKKRKHIDDSATLKDVCSEQKLKNHDAPVRSISVNEKKVKQETEKDSIVKNHVNDNLPITTTVITKTKDIFADFMKRCQVKTGVAFTDDSKPPQTETKPCSVNLGVKITHQVSKDVKAMSDNAKKFQIRESKPNSHNVVKLPDEKNVIKTETHINDKKQKEQTTESTCIEKLKSPKREDRSASIKEKSQKLSSSLSIKAHKDSSVTANRGTSASLSKKLTTSNCQKNQSSPKTCTTKSNDDSLHSRTISKEGETPSSKSSVTSIKASQIKEMSQSKLANESTNIPQDSAESVKDKSVNINVLETTKNSSPPGALLSSDQKSTCSLLELNNADPLPSVISCYSFETTTRETTKSLPKEEIVKTEDISSLGTSKSSNVGDPEHYDSFVRTTGINGFFQSISSHESSYIEPTEPMIKVSQTNDTLNNAVLSASETCLEDELVNTNQDTSDSINKTLSQAEENYKVNSHIISDNQVQEKEVTDINTEITQDFVIESAQGTLLIDIDLREEASPIETSTDGNGRTSKKNQIQILAASEQIDKHDITNSYIMSNNQVPEKEVKAKEIETEIRQDSMIESAHGTLPIDAGLRQEALPIETSLEGNGRTITKNQIQTLAEPEPIEEGEITDDDDDDTVYDQLERCQKDQLHVPSHLFSATKNVKIFNTNLEGVTIVQNECLFANKEAVEITEDNLLSETANREKPNSRSSTPVQDERNEILIASTCTVNNKPEIKADVKSQIVVPEKKRKRQIRRNSAESIELNKYFSQEQISSFTKSQRRSIRRTIRNGLRNNPGANVLIDFVDEEDTPLKNSPKKIHTCIKGPSRKARDLKRSREFQERMKREQTTGNGTSCTKTRIVSDWDSLLKEHIESMKKEKKNPEEDNPNQNLDKKIDDFLNNIKLRNERDKHKGTFLPMNQTYNSTLQPKIRPQLRNLIDVQAHTTSTSDTSFGDHQEFDHELVMDSIIISSSYQGQVAEKPTTKRNRDNDSDTDNESDSEPPSKYQKTPIRLPRMNRDMAVRQRIDQETGRHQYLFLYEDIRSYHWIDSADILRANPHFYNSLKRCFVPEEETPEQSQLKKTLYDLVGYPVAMPPS